MKKNGIIILVVLGIIAGGVFAWYLMSSSNSTSGNNTNTIPNNNNNSSNNSTSTTSIDIANFAFSPSLIKAKVGDKITWTNKDFLTHTIASDSGPQNFSSGDISNGATFSFTFTKAGTYSYHCSLHPSMTGTITIE